MVYSVKLCLTFCFRKNSDSYSWPPQQYIPHNAAHAEYCSLVDIQPSRILSYHTSATFPPLVSYTCYNQVQTFALVYKAVIGQAPSCI